MRLSIHPSTLTPAECAHLIAAARPQLMSATTLGPKLDGYRVADNCWLYESSPITDKLRNAVAAHTELPLAHQEQLHVVRYCEGGEYKRHQDFFWPNTDYYEQHMRNGGQRAFTAMCYLSECDGGETSFPKVGLTITPTPGTMVVWTNLSDTGEPDVTTLHAGLPVRADEKWIATVWVRAEARG